MLLRPLVFALRRYLVSARERYQGGDGKQEERGGASKRKGEETRNK